MRRLVTSAVVLAAACAPALPHQPAERALVRDVARVVDVRQRVGWLIDDVEIQAATPDAMKSACRVTPAARKQALDWLGGEIVRLGGPVETAFAARGKKLAKVDDLLLFTRARLLLTRADAWAGEGKCPFWMETDPGFRGVHVTGTRWLVTLEGGGRVTDEVVEGQKSVRVGAGGSGRLLVGKGLSENVVLAAGPEFGGAARFSDIKIGEQTEIPKLVAFLVVPTVVRWHFGLSTHFEAEVGPMAHIDRLQVDQENEAVNYDYDWGFHAGLGLGGSYLRLSRNVMPKFTFAVTVDVVPGDGVKPTLTQLSFGFRTGVDWSLLN